MELIRQRSADLASLFQRNLELRQSIRESLQLGELVDCSKTCPKLNIQLIEKLSALDDERHRVAQELHDSTGQLLVALSLSVSHLRHMPHDGSLDPAITDIGDIVALIDKEIRTLSFLEYPLELNTNGLSDTLENFARGLARRSGLRINCHFELDGVQFDRKTALALLRISQEAFSNVHRHAGATQAELTLTQQSNALRLVVTDNGCGPGPLEASSRPGVGLDGMRDRARQLGGKVEMFTLNPGTKIVATIPVANA